MQHQQAWRVLGMGDPWTVLALTSDIPIPYGLAEGEVLLKVQAAALNPMCVPSDTSGAAETDAYIEGTR